MSLHSAQHPHKRQVEILGHGRDLRHLVVAMHLGKAGIGVQPGNRPSLDLARREDEVHGMRLGMRGGEIKKSAREGGASGLNSSMIKGRVNRGRPVNGKSEADSTTSRKQASRGWPLATWLSRRWLP